MDTGLVRNRESSRERLRISSPPFANEPDPSQLLQWAEVILESEATEWRYFDRNGKPRRIYGTASELIGKLLDLNAAGHQVYPVINATSPDVITSKRAAVEEGRWADESYLSDRDITRVRAVFVDLDEDHGNNLDRILQSPRPPTAIVRSSQQHKLHA
ncbi:MAG: hypothetical protein WD314_08280 [Trueperaceae bacterium]